MLKAGRRGMLAGCLGGRYGGSGGWQQCWQWTTESGARLQSWSLIKEGSSERPSAEVPEGLV